MGLNLVVTGAGGFLGRAVVAEAKACGHSVRGLTRREVDLAADDLRSVLAGADCVIHLAAALDGVWAAHERDTLTATRRLITTMQAMAQPPRLVLASSIAVYSADPALQGHIITEATPLEPRPETRDSYARAKLAQERIARDSGLPLTILRPGAIMGPKRIWNAHLGPVMGPALILMERAGELPLVSRADCARAFVRAAEGAGQGGAYNILSGERPDRARFVAALRRTGWPRVILPVSWRLLHPVARLLSPFDSRLPGLLRAAVLRARMMPVRYDISAARAGLGWQPQEDFDTALIRAREAEL